MLDYKTFHNLKIKIFNKFTFMMQTDVVKKKQKKQLDL